MLLDHVKIQPDCHFNNFRIEFLSFAGLKDYDIERKEYGTKGKDCISHDRQEDQFQPSPTGDSSEKRRAKYWKISGGDSLHFRKTHFMKGTGREEWSPLDSLHKRALSIVKLTFGRKILSRSTEGSAPGGIALSHSLIGQWPRHGTLEVHTTELMVLIFSR